MFLGLRLPLVNSLLPIDSLDTQGTRALKTAGQIGEDGEISWRSKVDKFDDRLANVRRQFPRSRLDEVREQWKVRIGSRAVESPRVNNAAADASR